MTSVEILGVAVTTSSLDQVARDVVAWATGPRVASTPRYVCATSVHGLVEAARDPSFRAILNRAARVTPDGMPLIGRLPRWRGVLLAAGHFRQGILLAPITGELVADLVARRRPRLSLEAFDPGRFLVRAA